jgi:hypothetical protein
MVETPRAQRIEGGNTREPSAIQFWISLVLSAAIAPASNSMMSDFERCLNCTKVQVEASTPDCTRTNCLRVVYGELQSGEFQRSER